jgi:hypothetical protein
VTVSLVLSPWQGHSHGAALRAAALLIGAAALVGCQNCNRAATDGSAASGDASTVAIADGGALNVTPLPTASVAAMVNPRALPAYDGPVGSIEGTVAVTGDPAPITPNDFSRCPDAERVWGHAFREGPADASGARPLADAVVVVTGYKNFYVPEKREVEEVRIERCATSTRTVAMTFGQRLEVKNLSNDFWTPVMEPGSAHVLMMATPNGDPVKIYPKRPGTLLLRDRDRTYAVVDGFVLLHPLHATTSLTGYYRIDGIPVGKLKVSTLHPQIPGTPPQANATAEQEITVATGVVHTVDLVLKNVNRDAGASAQGDGGTPLLR